ELRSSAAGAAVSRSGTATSCSCSTRTTKRSRSACRRSWPENPGQRCSTPRSMIRSRHGRCRSTRPIRCRAARSRCWRSWRAESALVPVAPRLPQPLQQASRRTVAGDGDAIGAAGEARAYRIAVHEGRVEIDAARMPAQLRLLTDQREIDTPQTAGDRVTYDLGHRGRHHSVARPRGIEARMVQVEAVAEHEADARCDDRIRNAKLEYPDRIARGQPLTDIVEKRPGGTIGEAVRVNRAERHLGTQGMQFQETQQRPAHLDAIACHNE